jgi:ribonuclease BN (tRNA processing enzyme)
MRLTVVGCSGSYPGPDSPASCYLVEADGPVDPGDPRERPWRILLDLGNGALGALHRYVDPLEVDAVFLSHLHADHCLDLCGYHVLRRYHPAGPQPRLPVWGPAGTSARLAAAYGLPAEPGMTEEFDFHVHGEPVEVGPFTVEAVPVVHPVPAYGLRVTAGGRSIAYSGDTGPCLGLDRLAAGADLLLAEASFVAGKANPPDIHLTGSDCGVVAARGEVGRLVITHVPPWYDPAVAVAEAKVAYAGPIEVAASGATWDV